MSPYEEIEIKTPWDVVETMRQAKLLREHLVEFTSHTMQTLSRPRTELGPFGEVVKTDGVEHPLSHSLAVVDGIIEGCYKQYGKEMYRQSHHLMDCESYKGD